MEEFAAFLSNQVGSPVVDRTGLTGRYDFSLQYSTQGLAGPSGSSTSEPSDGQDIFGAIQSQLGLKLERTKGPVEVIAVDRADKAPVSN